MDRTLERARSTDVYASEVQMVHSLTSFTGLAALLPAESLLYHCERPGGPTVLAVRDDGLPEPYRHGVYGFRLAQYLRLRFASADLAFRRSLVTEPHGGHRNEIHVLALDGPSGAILRYLSLVGSTDPVPLHLKDPARTLFPCEVAHGVNLFEHVECDGDLDTSRVWEVKRLVHRAEQNRSSAHARLRLTLELMLGFYTALGRIEPAPEVLVGDGEEGIAIRRLLRSLKDITVLEGTRPSLPADDLMFPLYTQRDVVKPFVARAPHGEELQRLIRHIDRALSDRNPLDALKGLVETVGGRLRRVHV
ncbi:hypothetical protein ACFW3D_02015 [Streptomyces sp. NPDC058864]